jgi:hypothetical protein
MEHYTKLATLFDFDGSLEMLFELTEIGVIAGGSLVWCLLDIETSDVDLFVSSDVREEIQRIIQRYTCIRKVIVTAHAYNVFLVGGKVPLQVIIKSFHDPHSLISKFDMDYCECGLYQGKLIQTETCKDAHESMVCKRASYLDSRNVKAMGKGFHIPWTYDVTTNNALDAYDPTPDYAETVAHKELTKAKLLRERYASVGHLSISSPKYVRFSPKTGSHVVIEKNGEVIWDPNNDLKGKKHNHGNHFTVEMSRTIKSDGVWFERWCYSIPLRLVVTGVNEYFAIIEKKLSNLFHLNFCFLVGYGLVDRIFEYFDKEVLYSVEMIHADRNYAVLTFVIEGNYILPEYNEDLFDSL